MEKQNQEKCDHGNGKNECCCELHAEIIINRSSEIIIEKSRRHCNCEVSEFQKNESSYKAYTKKCKNIEDSTFETIINKEDSYKSEHIYPPNCSEFEEHRCDLVAENNAEDENKIDVYKVINKELKNRIKDVTEDTVNPVTKNTSEVNVLQIEREDTLKLNGKSKSRSLDDKKLKKYLKDDEKTDSNIQQSVPNVVPEIKQTKAATKNELVFKQNEEPSNEKLRDDTNENEEETYKPRRVRDTINRLNKLSEGNLESVQYEQKARRKKPREFKFKSDIPAWSYLNLENEKTIPMETETAADIRITNTSENTTKPENNIPSNHKREKRNENIRAEHSESRENSRTEKNENESESETKQSFERDLSTLSKNSEEDNDKSNEAVTEIPPNSQQKKNPKKKKVNKEKKGNSKINKKDNKDLNKDQNELVEVKSDVQDGEKEIIDQADESENGRSVSKDLKKNNNSDPSPEYDIPPKNMVKSIIQLMEKRQRELSEERNRSRDPSLEPKERTRKNTRDSSIDKSDGGLEKKNQREKISESPRKSHTPRTSRIKDEETSAKESVSNEEIIISGSENFVNPRNRVNSNEDMKGIKVSNLKKKFQNNNVEGLDLNDSDHNEIAQLRESIILEDGEADAGKDGSFADPKKTQMENENADLSSKIKLKTASQTINTVIHAGKSNDENETKEKEVIEKETTRDNGQDPISSQSVSYHPSISSDIMPEENDNLEKINDERNHAVDKNDEKYLKPKDYVEYIIEVIKDPLNLNVNKNNVFDTAFRDENQKAEIIHEVDLKKSLEELGDVTILDENIEENATNIATENGAKNGNDFKEHAQNEPANNNSTHEKQKNSLAVKNEVEEANDQDIKSSNNKITSYLEEFNTERTIITSLISGAEESVKKECSESIQECLMKSSATEKEIKKVEKQYENKIKVNDNSQKNEERKSVHSNEKQEQVEYLKLNQNEQEKEDTLEKIKIERKFELSSDGKEMIEKCLYQSFEMKSGNPKSEEPDSDAEGKKREILIPTKQEENDDPKGLSKEKTSTQTINQGENEGGKYENLHNVSQFVLTTVDVSHKKYTDEKRDENKDEFQSQNTPEPRFEDNDDTLIIESNDNTTGNSPTQNKEGASDSTTKSKESPRPKRSNKDNDDNPTSPEGKLKILENEEDVQVEEDDVETSEKLEILSDKEMEENESKSENDPEKKDNSEETITALDVDHNPKTELNGSKDDFINENTNNSENIILHDEKADQTHNNQLNKINENGKKADDSKSSNDPVKEISVALEDDDTSNIQIEQEENKEKNAIEAKEKKEMIEVHNSKGLDITNTVVIDDNELTNMQKTEIIDSDVNGSLDEVIEIQTIENEPPELVKRSIESEPTSINKAEQKDNKAAGETVVTIEIEEKDMMEQNDGSTKLNEEEKTGKLKSGISKDGTNKIDEKTLENDVGLAKIVDAVMFACDEIEIKDTNDKDKTNENKRTLSSESEILYDSEKDDIESEDHLKITQNTEDDTSRINSVSNSDLLRTKRNVSTTDDKDSTDTPEQAWKSNGADKKDETYTKDRVTNVGAETEEDHIGVNKGSTENEILKNTPIENEKTAHGTKNFNREDQMSNKLEVEAEIHSTDISTDHNNLNDKKETTFEENSENYIPIRDVKLEDEVRDVETEENDGKDTPIENNILNGTSKEAEEGERNVKGISTQDNTLNDDSTEVDAEENNKDIANDTLKSDVKEAREVKSKGDIHAETDENVRRETEELEEIKDKISIEDNTLIAENKGADNEDDTFMDDKRKREVDESNEMKIQEDSILNDDRREADKINTKDIPKDSKIVNAIENITLNGIKKEAEEDESKKYTAAKDNTLKDNGQERESVESQKKTLSIEHDALNDDGTGAKDDYNKDINTEDKTMDDNGRKPEEERSDAMSLNGDVIKAEEEYKKDYSIDVKLMNGDDNEAKTEKGKKKNTSVEVKLDDGTEVEAELNPKDNHLIHNETANNGEGKAAEEKNMYAVEKETMTKITDKKESPSEDQSLASSRKENEELSKSPLYHEPSPNYQEPSGPPSIRIKRNILKENDSTDTTVESDEIDEHGTDSKNNIFTDQRSLKHTEGVVENSKRENSPKGHSSDHNVKETKEQEIFADSNKMNILKIILSEPNTKDSSTKMKGTDSSPEKSPKDKDNLSHIEIPMHEAPLSQNGNGRADSATNKQRKNSVNHNEDDSNESRSVELLSGKDSPASTTSLKEESHPGMLHKKDSVSETKKEEKRTQNHEKEVGNDESNLSEINYDKINDFIHRERLYDVHTNDPLENINDSNDKEDYDKYEKNVDNNEEHENETVETGKHSDFKEISNEIKIMTGVTDFLENQVGNDEPTLNNDEKSATKAENIEKTDNEEHAATNLDKVEQINITNEYIENKSNFKEISNEINIIKGVTDVLQDQIEVGRSSNKDQQTVSKEENIEKTDNRKNKMSTNNDTTNMDKVGKSNTTNKEIENISKFNEITNEIKTIKGVADFLEDHQIKNEPLLNRDQKTVSKAENFEKTGDSEKKTLEDSYNTNVDKVETNKRTNEYNFKEISKEITLIEDDLLEHKTEVGPSSNKDQKAVSKAENTEKTTSNSDSTNVDQFENLNETGDNEETNVSKENKLESSEIEPLAKDDQISIKTLIENDQENDYSRIKRSNSNGFIDKDNANDTSSQHIKVTKNKLDNSSENTSHERNIEISNESITIEKTYDVENDEMKLDISHTFDESQNQNINVVAQDEDYPNISVQIKISYNTAEEKGSLDQKFTLNNIENNDDIGSPEPTSQESLDRKSENKHNIEKQNDSLLIPKSDYTCVKKSTYTCIEENFDLDKSELNKNVLKKTNIINDQNLLRNKDSKVTEVVKKMESFDSYEDPKSDYNLGKLTMKKHTMREIKSFEYQEYYEDSKENLQKFHKRRGGRKKYNKNKLKNTGNDNSSEDSKQTDSDTSSIEHELIISEPPSKENKDGAWGLQGVPIASNAFSSKSRSVYPRSNYYNAGDICVNRLSDEKMNNESYQMNLNTYQDINIKNKNKPIQKIKNKTRSCCSKKRSDDQEEKKCSACSYYVEDNRPLFVTTVKKGTFLEPPPEIAAMLGLSPRERNAGETKGNMVYSFSSKPRPCQHKRDLLKSENSLGNENTTRRDQKKLRGPSTSHQHVPQHNPDIIGMEAQGFRFTEAKRRTMTRSRVQASQYRHLRTHIDSPPPITGRKHEIVQTLQTGDILEEITDNPSTRSLSIQTDPSFDSIPSTSTSRKAGKTADCEVQTDDVFDYTYDVQPVLDVILSSAYRDALMEVLQEDEQMHAVRKERIFKEARNQNEDRDHDGS